MAAEKPYFVPARQDFMIPSLRPPVTHEYKEHPGYINEKAFIIPLAPPAPDNFPELPYHLRKFVLRRIEMENSVDGKNIASLWNQRSLYAEKRVQKLISKIPGAQNPVRNERYTKDDSAGKDLYFELDGLGINVEVKSSRFGVHKFKKMIWDTYFPNSAYDEEWVRNWLAENRTVLVNGSETRSDNEIYAAILPQIKLIQETAIAKEAA